MADEPTATPDTDLETEDAVDAGPEPIHGVLATDSLGQTVLHPTREQYVALVKALHDDGYAVCIDLTGVDYLTHPGRTNLPDGITPERFEVVVALLRHTDAARLRLRVQVPADDATLPSLSRLHPGVEGHERETYDMFGITFDDHPDMTRILLPEDWIGHPLRKDYDSGRIPVQFKASTARPVARS
jgi:NADH-quinone oxidoreductase subunit C